MTETFDPQTWYFKNPGVVAAGYGQRYLFIRPQSGPLMFEPPVAQIVAKIVARIGEPVLGSDLQSACNGLEGDWIGLLAQLVNERVIIASEKERMSALLEALQPPQVHNPCDHLVVGITGGAQAPLVFPYLDQIYFRFCHHLDIILTQAATRFVRPEAFVYLYDAHVWIDLFETQTEMNVPHIQIAEQADAVVVLPATAHALHRFATAECSDLLSLVVTATRAPVILIPAMNQGMWSKPSVQRNVGQLREDGFCVVEPGLGYEACSKHAAKLRVGGPGVDPKGLVALLGLLSHHESAHKDEPA